MTEARVQRLSAFVADQIAAGEVVERPASIVKELVENSLDAHATNIEVRSVAGGVESLWVRDNGSGIHKDDLALAVERHATSKIAHAQDLLGIGSLGFRGEALASVASVSRFKISSAQPQVDAGWYLETHGGAAVGSGPVAHNQGTSVEVWDLFFQHAGAAQISQSRANREPTNRLSYVPTQPGTYGCRVLLGAIQEWPKCSHSHRRRIQTSELDCRRLRRSARAGAVARICRTVDIC